LRWADSESLRNPHYAYTWPLGSIELRLKMKDYLKSWIPRIQDFSLKLDKLSKLYNQPWVLVNDLNDFIKIIFQDRGKLIVSRNGVVSDGSWELVSSANSILLDINNEKRLYNHQFIDNGLMILTLDGHSTDFFVLANQNIIPDLDVLSYLTAKYSVPSSSHRKTSVVSNYEKEVRLQNGHILQIVKDLGYSGSSVVKINNKDVPEGFYRLANQDIAYEIRDSKIKMEYYIEKFKQEDGQIIEIAGNRISGITKGSPVWLEDHPAPDGQYKKGWFSKIEVKNGKII